jgi:hypothetical protein
MEIRRVAVYGFKMRRILFHNNDRIDIIFFQGVFDIKVQCVRRCRITDWQTECLDIDILVDEYGISSVDASGKYRQGIFQRVCFPVAVVYIINSINRIQ